MNIYEKLAKARLDVQSANLKKSGKNTYAGYQYYELGDFLPTVNHLMTAYKLCPVLSFDKEVATLTIIDAEKPDDKIVFTSPMADANLKGAHDIQNLGAVETYQRRYLYMTAFEIVEHDFFDATQGAPATKQPAKKAPQKQASNLSKETGAKINDAIKQCSKSTGKKISDIVAGVESLLKKPMAQATEDDAAKILDIIQSLDVPF